MVRHGRAPYLECSSAGDSRFSAFYARIRARGNMSIEEIYQAAKVFEGGKTGLSWREAKGKKPINIAYVRGLYSRLWREYIEENPQLKQVILSSPGLQDKYGKESSACQATELWNIRNELLSNP